jgi:EpsG family
VLIIISFITLIGFVRLTMFSKLNSKKCYVITAGLLLFIIASFRTIHFGPDVMGYVDRYISLTYESLSLYWNYFISGEGKDPIFYLSSKIISNLNMGYQMWLAILSGIFIFSVSKLIYKHSDEPYISFISLISLGYFFFSLTGLRQTLALSILLLSYDSLRNKKLIKFIIMVIIASLFHSSALVFLIAYPLANMKIGIKHVFGIVGSFIFATFFENAIRDLITIISWSDQLYEYSERSASLTISGFIIQLCIYLFCLLYKKEVLQSDIRNLILYNLLFIGVILQAFATVIAEFFRISMYFSIYSIVLIPIAINTIKDNNIKVIVYLFVNMALIVYILWNGDFYGFKFSFMR